MNSIIKLTINVNKGGNLMREEVVSKVNKIGKVGRIISKIGKVILSIGLVCCLVGCVLLMMVPKDLATLTMSSQAVVEVEDMNFSNLVSFKDLEMDTSIDVNGMTFEINEVENTGDYLKATTDQVTHTIDLRDMVWMLGLGMMVIVSAYILLHYVGKLCHEFEICETPFTDEIVKGISHLAIALIPLAVFGSIMESLNSSILYGNMDVVFQIDLMSILYILLIFMLASIFKYGTLLQKESDETL